jgi:hypothetical protein
VGAGAKQPVPWFLGDKDVVIQQGTNVWVGLPSPSRSYEVGVDQLFGENRQLVTDELVEFENYSVDVGDFRRITNHLRGIYRIYLK